MLVAPIVLVDSFLVSGSNLYFVMFNALRRWWYCYMLPIIISMRSVLKVQLCFIARSGIACRLNLLCEFGVSDARGRPGWTFGLREGTFCHSALGFAYVLDKLIII